MTAVDMVVVDMIMADTKSKKARKKFITKLWGKCDVERCIWNVKTKIRNSLERISLPMWVVEEKLRIKQ